MELVKHETCLQYFQRRLSEGWKITKRRGFLVILESPEGIIRPVDLRNDVETLRPDGVGNATELEIAGSSPAATNWESVDEVVADDGITYVQKIDVGIWETDTYGLPDSEIGSGTIKHVTVYARCYGYTPGIDDMTARVTIRTHDTDYHGDDEQWSGDGVWEDYSKQWTTNPKTTELWTWDEIDALEAGISLYCDNKHPNFIWCTQVYVEVDYETAPPAHIPRHSGSVGVLIF